MSIEFLDKCRLKSIDDYRIIFETYPNIKELALDYWNQIQGKNLKQEEKIFDKTVLEISNQLLDNPIFTKATEQEGKDPIECAIIESFFMIDIVQDV